jgi:hypothetical protein
VAQAPFDLSLQCLRTYLKLLQHVDGKATVVAEDADEQMLEADSAVPTAPRLFKSQER